MKSGKSENSIVMLYPFFGRLPWYFKYFIISIKYNSSIDFMIFTDHEPEIQLPKNVSFIKMTLAEFKRNAEESLGFDIQVEPQPFKFCDFRSAFGLLFRRYINGYDFWGHGDIDVIFGNIRNFMTEKMLNHYDMLCLRPDYISSWFTLYRNTPKMNNLFKKSKDYQKAFSTARYFNFDETNFKFYEFAHNIPFHLIKSEIESMTHLVRKLQERKAIRAHFDMHAIEGKPGNIKWVKGRLIYKNIFEVMLYHLLELKHVYKPKAAPIKVPDTFYISPTRIYF